MDPFIIKLFLSLVVGSTWVVLSTVVAEKISGKIGGLILGLPSTAAISILFIGLTQDLPHTMAAIAIVPFSSGVYCFFYIAYLLFSKKDFWTGFLGSLAVWFFFAFLSSSAAPHTMLLSTIIWFFLVAGCLGFTIRFIHINHAIIPKKIIGAPVLVKALVTGIVICFVVLISKVAGPRWGGIFATFPALISSTFLLTVKPGGVEFTRLLAKNVLISTSITIGLFAILSYILFPLVGVLLGSICAYVGLLVISIPLYYFVFDKVKE